MSVSESAQALKGSSRFLGFFHLTQMARVPTGFYSEALWELLFLGLKLWVGKPLCVASASCSFRVNFEAIISLLLLKYLLHVGVEPSLLSFSAPSSGLDVAFPLHSQMYVL